MSVDVLDGFCGIGVGLGLAELGLTEHGIDNEPAVADTRARLGMATTLGDITTLDPHDWAGVEGCWFSPPCTDWSRAGKGLGLEGSTGRLVFEPLRWVEAIRPRWVAMEQVPEAREAFRAMARQLEGIGYRATVVRLSSEEYGVPQTRERVYLLAHRDRAPRIPPSTHQPYAPGVPPERPTNLFGLLPWISMAEALGWPDGIVLDRRQTDAPTIDTWAAPCPTITGAAVGKGVWELNRGVGYVDRLAPSRPVTDPAPTLIAHIGQDIGTDNDRWTWQLRGGNQEHAIKLTTVQGCTLQGFPRPERVAAALPSSKRKAWQLIGNAVASPMATRIVEGLL